jgi:hypothetical protein
VKPFRPPLAVRDKSSQLRYRVPGAAGFVLIAIAFFQAARLIWGNIHDRSSLVLRGWR